MALLLSSRCAALNSQSAATISGSSAEICGTTVDDDEPIPGLLASVPQRGLCVKSDQSGGNFRAVATSLASI